MDNHPRIALAAVLRKRYRAPRLEPVSFYISLRVKHSHLITYRSDCTGTDIVAHLDLDIDLKPEIDFLQDRRLHVSLENQRASLRNGDFKIAIVIRKSL